MMASGREKKKLIQQFCSITGADKDAAKKILEVCKYNVEMAINMHVEAAENSENSSNVDKPTSSSSPVIVDDVRPPIPPVQGVLVDTVFAAGVRARRRITRSVFDGFRDFEAEAREQEQELWNRGGSTSAQKCKTLEDLFRPPLDMMHRGSFDSAREAGQYENKWLMINIQNVQEFQCQVLNRDVWSNQAVKSIVREHFVFWQVYHDSEEGQRYIQFYKVLQWPYVAVIDPRTGENMVVWNNIDQVSFCDLVSEFLTAHPSLDGSVMPSPPAKRARSESILDASEDSQLEAAIRASLAENTTPTQDGVSTSNTTVQNSDSENSSSSRCQSYSAQNSEDEDVEIETFETDSEESNPANVNNNIPAKDGGTGGAPKKSATEEHVSSDWKQHLGVSEDPESNLIIRYPDGSKEQLKLPSSSKLLALILYVRSKGFSEDKYELVTNFPRKQLSRLDAMISLNEAGLFPQETVFVQAR